MNLERVCRLSSIGLTALSFLGLALTGQLPSVLTILGALALLFSGASAIGLGGGFLRLAGVSPRGWNLLLLAAFAFFGFDLLLISREVLSAAVHFLILLMIHKLFHLNQPKDFLQLYAISLMELLAAAALTQDLWYAAVFFAYLFTAIWTLLLYHLGHEAAEANVETGVLRRLVTPRLFWMTNGIAVGAFCLTLVIFFLIPRVGIGFFQKNRADLIRTSGFSERVDLGVIGAVKLDPTVVMRVEFPEEAGPLGERRRLYFRGTAYDGYNGRSWTNTFARRHALELTSEGVFMPPSSRKPARAISAGVRQEILIEPLDTPVLFALSHLHSVKGNFPVVQADGMGTYYLLSTPSMRFQYSAISVPERLQEEDRQEADPDYPDLITERYLPVPKLDPRVAGLAREVTRDSSTPYAKASAVERHLRRNYQYSLDVGTVATDSPLEEFLFKRKTGYCEHYATAMVVMLRTLGIPARLVTGFLSGQWNDFGRYYTVRQQDSHAWVEVFFPRSGWITFDPTPPTIDLSGGSIVAGLAKVVDSLRLRWDRYVVQYSFHDQVLVVQGVRERGDAIRAQVIAVAARLARWAAGMKVAVADLVQGHIGIFLVLMAGALGLLAVLSRGLKITWARRRLSSRSGKQPQLVATRLYRQMLRVLEGRGFPKPPGATPLEFARMVAGDWTEAAVIIQALTELYCRIRFGQTSLGSQELNQANKWLSALRVARR